MKLTKEQGLSLLSMGEDDIEGFDYKDVISDKEIDTSRWSSIHELTFKHDGKFYQTEYRIGLTECQDESPWEYSEPNCYEVEPKEVMTTVYTKVKT